MQQIFVDAAHMYRMFGRKIIASRTEVNVWSPSSPSKYSFSIDGEPLDVLDSFKYLGSYISNDCRLDDEAEKRVNQPSRAYGRLRELVL